MTETAILALVMMFCLVLLCGINLFLAVSMVRKEHADGKAMADMSNAMQFVQTEIAGIGRSIRKLTANSAVPASAENAANPADDPAMVEFQQFQESGFQEIARHSLDSHQLLQEFSQLKDKELAAWKSANQSKLDSMLGDHAALHGKLVASQESLDSANQTIRSLQGKVGRLAGADARAKALEGIRQSLENELQVTKNLMHRLNGELSSSRQSIMEAKAKLEEQDAQNKAMHENYLKDRQQLEAERTALEMRLDSMQQAFDHSFDNLKAEDPLKEAHEKFLQEREAMEGEKRRLEEQLQNLQENYDRTLVEKAFIESVFLDQENENGISDF